MRNTGTQIYVPFSDKDKLFSRFVISIQEPITLQDSINDSWDNIKPSFLVS